MSDIRFCRMCRWMEPNAEPEQARCLHATSVWQPLIDLVTGETPPMQQLLCRSLRDRAGVLGNERCGSEGRHWQAR